MSVDTLLARLDRPRKTGPHSWRAPCPAHGGKNRDALAIRETDDGRVLLKCFSQECSAADIVAAVGLGLHELFPPRSPDDHRRPRERRPFNPADILAAVASEITVAWLIVRRAVAAESLTETDRERLFIAAGRLNAGVEACHGH